MAPLLDYAPVPALPLGPLTIRTWGLFVALGILVAARVAARRAKRSGIPAARIWDLAFWVIVAGLLGARLLYVVEYWRDFASEPARALAFWEGGLSAFGAILFGIPAATWYAKKRRWSFLELTQVVAPALLLGDAIGRLGGAASHMYAGRPTMFPISYVLNGVQRHEVGIELAAASFVGFIFLLVLERLRRSTFSREQFPIPNPQFPGRLGHWVLVIGHSQYQAVLVLVWYCAERFLLDFLRASDLPNSDLRYAGLTLAQILSLVGLVGAVGLFARERGRAPAGSRA